MNIKVKMLNHINHLNQIKVSIKGIQWNNTTMSKAGVQLTPV